MLSVTPPWYRAIMRRLLKRQPERENPDGLAWLCDLIWDLLYDWEPEECDSEDEYTDDLVEFGGRASP